MKRGDHWWFVLVLVLYFVGGQAVWAWLGLVAYIAWLLFSFPAGYVTGRWLKRRHRESRIEEWRVSHPTMPDDWLPEDLRQ